MNREQFDTIQVYLDLYWKVAEHMKWSDDKTHSWFHTNNPHCGNITPTEYFCQRPEKCRNWISSLIEENALPRESQ